jgi:hypothetical protein
LLPFVTLEAPINAISYVFSTLAGYPLRHPKSSARASFSASSEAAPFQNRFNPHHHRQTLGPWRLARLQLILKVESKMKGSGFVS